MINPREYQVRAVGRCATAVGEGRRRIILHAPTGCHAPGQGILMHDGSIKAVEDVAVGDLLMGPDSSPRGVLSLHRGVDEMHRIIPTKGRPFVVNAGHVLTLAKTGTQSVVDVTVREWISWSKWLKHLHKLVNSDGVDFPTTNATMPIDPYFLGVLLGDGSLKRFVAVSNPRPEIGEEVRRQASLFGLGVRTDSPDTTSLIMHLTAGRSWHKDGGNRLWNALKEIGLAGADCHEKFVPRPYLMADRESRLKLLAGLLDTDGHLAKGYYEFTVKSRRLAGDTAFLARSLGFFVTHTETFKTCQTGAGDFYQRLSILGHVDRIPCRVGAKKATPRLQVKNVLRRGFEVHPHGNGEYFGFTLDGDGRYLMDDFTVTHNSGKTIMAAHMIQRAVAKRKRVLFLAAARELINQSSDKLREAGVHHGIIMAGHGYTRSPVQVASVQTLMARALKAQKIGLPHADLVFVDECLTGDSLIETARGAVRLDTVVPGDLVLSHDGQHTCFRSVLRFMNQGRKPTIRVTLSSGKIIRCTTNHPIMTQAGWRAAGLLKAGDVVVTASPNGDSDTTAETSSTSSDLTCRRACDTSCERVVDVEPGPMTNVYDIEVEGTHCFFANGVLVHNCHQSMARGYLSLLEQYPEAVVVGLTATPARKNGKQLGDFYEAIVPTATKAELIKDGFLVPCTVYGWKPPSLKGVRVVGGDYVEQELCQRVNQPKLVGNIVRHWLELAGGRPTVAFAVSVAHSFALSQEFNAKGVPWGHVDGRTKPEERERLFARFRDGALKGLASCNVLCLDEQTEILTNQGWVGIDEMTYDHQVANYVHEGDGAGTIFFDQPKAIVRRPRGANEPMVSASSRRLDVRVTADHQMLYRTYSGGRFHKAPARELANRAVEVPVSGKAAPLPLAAEDAAEISPHASARKITSAAYALRQRHPGMSREQSRLEVAGRLSRRLKLRRTQPADLRTSDCLLIGFFLAEGHRYDKRTRGGVSYAISQSMAYPAIISWFDKVLEDSGTHALRYEWPRKGDHGVVQWVMWRGTSGDGRNGAYRLEPYLSKEGSQLLWALNETQWEAFLTGFWYGDGQHGQATSVPRSLNITNANKKLIDLVQAISVCRGWRATIGRVPNQKEDHHAPVWTINLRKKSHMAISHNRLRVEEPRQDERVWCVTSTSGNIMTRRNGVPIITGNCTGVDFPWASCGIMARPTKSFVLYTQMCLDDQTEVLTSMGWMKHDQLSASDAKVASWDRSTGLVHWCRPQNVFRRRLHDGEQFYGLRSPHLDIRVTGGHTMVYRSAGPTSTTWKTASAEHLASKKGDFVIPISGCSPDSGLPLTDAEVRFIGWVLSDGTINPANKVASISQSRSSPYNEEIRQCLQECGFKFGVYSPKRTGDLEKYEPCLVYYVSYGNPRGRDKHLSGWARLNHYLSRKKHLEEAMFGMSQRQLAIFLDAMHKANGSKLRAVRWTPKTFRICVGASAEFAGQLQALCVTHGFRCNVSAVTNKPSSFNTKNAPTTQYVIRASMGPKGKATVKGRQSREGSRFAPLETDPGEHCWCLTTEQGTLVTRRNGKVAIVGNCGRLLRPFPGKQDALILDHAGCVTAFGFPDEDVVWELDESARIQDVVREKLKKGEMKNPVNCPQCGHTFYGNNVCPKCRYAIPPKQYAKMLHHKDAALQLLRKSEEVLTPAARRNLLDVAWNRALGITAHKNGSFGMAAALFKAQTGKLPWEVPGLPHLPPGGDWKLKVADLAPGFLKAKA